MARGPGYRVPFRRRRERRTDYRLRRRLVMSGQPRLVARKTLRHMTVQVVEARVRGDETLVSAHSRELVKTYGWRGGCGNIPAAYLTGLLCGYRAVAKGIKEAILDAGLQSPSRGARVFAALKGVVDAGVAVPHDEGVLPEESRVGGRHVAEYATRLSSNSDLYRRAFSGYLAAEMPPEQLPAQFSLTREKIVSELAATQK